MVCLHCNLFFSRAEVGIIGVPPVRVRVRVWTACYKRVLKGVVFGVFDHTWWKKPENQGKPPILEGQPLSCHMPIYPYSNSSRSGDKQVFYHYANQAQCDVEGGLSNMGILT